MKNKRKRWFEKSNIHSPYHQDLFSNTIKKHSEELKKKKLIDDDGFEILPEDEYGYSSRNWELDNKLSKESSGDKKKRYEINKEEYSNAYTNYEKTGVWNGYYRQPQLTYKYIQQMANALSAKHNIKLEIGSDWKVDLISKTLTYNPASLVYGTKSELLATLMHVIGKLRYVTHHSLLKNTYIQKYDMPAREVLAAYEDLRVDFLMLKAYESASEIYENIIPTIEEQVNKYMKVGEAFRKLIYLIPVQIFAEILNGHTNSKGVLNPKDPKLKLDLHNKFGTTDLDAVQLGLALIESKSENVGTIYEWCGEMLSEMYTIDPLGHKEFTNIKEKMKLLHHTIEPSKIKKNSRELSQYLETAVYPILEDLLKDAQERNKIIEDAFPMMPAEVMEQIMDRINEEFMHKAGIDPQNENSLSRQSGPSNNKIPPEWLTGEYKTLKDSVGMEIRQLVRRLTFMRREELSVRYVGDQKRGRLNTKKLYKSSVGSSRVFKSKLEVNDTIRSFAFSILLDVSGSMDGVRILHTTRALIILTEVFKQMQIPFEIVVFSNGAKTVKEFEKEMDKTIEKKIGGLVNHRGGGTNLDVGLDRLKIEIQTEKNRFVIVLTDGGVGNVSIFDRDYFLPWKKKNIKSVGFGIECEREMVYLCIGNSRVLKSASELPAEFAKLLKELIKR